jgi:hypothetical protein
MTTINKSADDKATERNYAKLEAQYGKVGISAVAAAMRYQSDQNEREAAPSWRRPNERD